MRPVHEPSQLDEIDGIDAKLAHGETTMNAEDPKLPATNPDEAATPRVSRSSLVALIVVVLIVAAVSAVVGIVHRIHANSELVRYTDANAAPPVSLAQPVFEKDAREIVLPGNMQAFTLAPIYARTTGYVKSWSHDIGSHVHKGDLLAVIETPELDQQLAQAKADLATAQSNAALAKVTADRYRGLIAQNAVSQQDTDNAISQLEARSTEVNSAQANVHRLEELQSFERIEAPFDGVITARNIDIGQLIDPGAGRELFHLQALQTLRVYANLPQVYSANVKPGAKIDLTFAEHAGTIYQGTLVRTADAIDPVSRTLLVEIDVDNHAGVLLPGSLAQVHFKTPSAQPALIVPAAALIFRREGLRVGVVVNGDTARLVPVVIGEDDGASVQIISGLSIGDQVIQDPPDSLIDNEKVQVVSPGSHTGGGGN